MMKQKLLNRIVLLSSLSTLALSACGPQAFVPTTVVSDQTAAGGMNLPPKVDIVLGLSNGGTMQNIYPGLQPEIAAFANSLQNKGWDYRFVTLSLSEYSPGSSANIGNAVAASHYHSNYPQSEWMLPFPGAVYTDPQFLLSPSLFSSTLTIPTLDYSYNNGRETGLKNQAAFISRSDVQANVLRPDAMLAVMTISNGKDTSDGWYNAWNGLQSNTVNVDSYVNQIKAVRADAKYYAIVAHNTTNCRVGGAWSGIDYERAAQKLGGISQDICTTPIATALNAVAQHLQTQKLSFVKKYLVIGTEPNPATIKVYKNGAELANNSTNGWTYVGYSTQYTIDSPVPMAQATGYMVELHGTAKLHGTDTGRVEYMNAGAQSSH
jgi:hypothetical protein